jgi:hypothetical protein
MDVLDLQGKASFNDVFTEWDFHTHAPYANSGLSKNDEIRIPCNQADTFTLPSESYLLVEGRLLEKADTVNKAYKLVSNVIPHLFEEIRWELSGVEVCRAKDVGVLSTMRNYLLLDSNDKRLSSMGWDHESGTISVDETNGKFTFCYPLRLLLPVFDDYKKVILSVRHELILLRSSSDVNAVVLPTTSSNFILTLSKVHWKIPYLKVDDITRLDLLKYVNANIPIEIPFRQWELHQFPAFPQTTHQVWNVKSSSNMETPRYVIVGFHSSSRGVTGANMSNFDDVKVNNIRLYLNSDYYPYDDSNSETSIFYQMYSRFKSSYNCDMESGPLLSFSEFKSKAGLIVLDSSKQPTLLKSAHVDVRLEIKSNQNIPKDTYAYCLIVYDVIYQYLPLTGTVQKVL